MSTIYGSQPLLLWEGVLIRLDATIYGSEPLLLRIGSSLSVCRLFMEVRPLLWQRNPDQQSLRWLCWHGLVKHPNALLSLTHQNTGLAANSIYANKRSIIWTIDRSMKLHQREIMGKVRHKYRLISLCMEEPS